MIAGNVGYVTFLVNSVEPHLATWDGSCWTDAKLGDGSNEQFVVKVDANEYQTAGAGTTDLVVARLTNSEPVPNRFRLYAGDLHSSTDGIAMAARGDTLLVAAVLNRGSTPVLRYLEIDSTRLQ